MAAVANSGRSRAGAVVLAASCLLGVSGKRTAWAGEGGAAGAAPASGAAAATGSGAASSAPLPRPSGLASLAALAEQVLERVHRERLAAQARPQPVEVRWNPRRIATLDVGGSLGALIGADLDADQVPELYAVTDQAVIVYGLGGPRGRGGGGSADKIRELARLSFPGAPAAIRPRDPVATVAVDAAAGELMAGSSSYARSVRARWQNGALVVLEELDGLPLCAHQRGQLVAGRNYFLELAAREPRAGAAIPTSATSPMSATSPTSATSSGGDARAPALGAQWRKDAAAGKDKGESFYGQRCRDELPLAEGGRARAVARLPVDGPLKVMVQPRCDGGAGCPPRHFELPGVGVAFDVGDVDRDGRIDVAYAGAGAPGDPDAVRVVPVTDPRRTLFRRAFTGGVAAVALVDLDGDGAAEVIAAVRLPGSPRVDLWRLN